ncbi:hypothetical protein ADEAN_000456200 [Angomonas deanei]|uniref:Uncharacterized protein n=1 Tax=Angomonas deanei TaxID=59799 RepID=A0A7G2CDZ2_9TRYP|nr:hypothetical protein ADEAN_000456200 [Angomonas deanei]
MFRRCTPILVTIRNGADRSWQPRKTKHEHRYSKQALQTARGRFIEQQRNQKAFQSINRDYHEYQKQLNREATNYREVAHGIMHRTKHIANKSSTRVTPKDRAEGMQAARHLLEMEMGKKKEMHDNKRRRQQTFSAVKKWK